MSTHYPQHPTAGRSYRQQDGYAALPPCIAQISSLCPGSPRVPAGGAGAGCHSLSGTTTTATAASAPVSDLLGDRGRRESCPGGSGSSRQQEKHPTGSSSLASSAAQPKPIRRRMRMITSCLECRRRKLGCNKSSPCNNCTRFRRECVYLGPKLDEAGQLRLTEIKEKVGSLEWQLERDVARGKVARGGDGDGDGGEEGEGGFGGGEERDLQVTITPMVSLDLTYEDYAEEAGTDDLIDLGIRVGKMRITERIGGLNRPRLAEEIQAGLAGNQMASGSGTCRALGAEELPDAPDGELPDLLKPGESYLPPSSGFLFSQAIESPSFIDLLPSPALCHSLIQRYREAVHPIARCVHWPSFEGLYQSFWDDVRRNMEPRASVQAVVFAAWFSAAVSLDESRLQREHGCAKSQVVWLMKVATETALSKAGFLRTTRVDTLQAFVMYLLPICRDEVSRSHSVLVGAAVRMAQCMGLHRDPSAYGLSPLETHVRRLIWHQLCFLDIRTCEAQGPGPTIRRDDYDTKLPVNCEEAELTAHTAVMPAPAEKWTSTLFSVMRFEVYGMMRTIWADRRRLEAKKMTLAAVLAKIESFRKRIAEKYIRLLDDNVPIQRYSKLVVQLLVYRLHAMVLHPYHANAASPLPDKLHGLLVTSGIFIIEIAVQLESSALFRDWAWYLGAYQQYQIALLLATEIYYRPHNKDAERIWRCLDYVFRMDPNVPRQQKALQILTEVMNKTSVYMGLRRVRAPAVMTKAVPAKQAVKEANPPRQPPQSPPQGTPPFRQPPRQHGGGGGAAGIQDPQAEPIAPSSASATPPASSIMSAAPTVTMGDHDGAPLPPPPQPPGFTPSMVYACVPNGETVWSLPSGVPGSSNYAENSGDGGVNQQQPHRLVTMDVPGPVPLEAAGAGLPVNVLDNIDWDMINTLFPTDPRTGELSFNRFVDPGIGPSGVLSGNWPS
ncbi:hypothetical protein VTK56DRAFT_483 [Thermocarpiscus australiensis]